MKTNRRLWLKVLTSLPLLAALPGLLSCLGQQLHLPCNASLRGEHRMES